MNWNIGMRFIKRDVQFFTRWFALLLSSPHARRLNVLIITRNEFFYPDKYSEWRARVLIEWEELSPINKRGTAGVSITWDAFYRLLKLTSNSVIKSLTNDARFARECRATLQFYFRPRNFIRQAHAIQRITITPRLMYFRAGSRARTRPLATLARQRPPPTEFHFCKLFFHFVPWARALSLSLSLSSRVSGIEPRGHNKSFLSFSLATTPAFFCPRLTTRLSFSITIKSRRRAYVSAL